MGNPALKPPLIKGLLICHFVFFMFLKALVADIIDN